MVKVYNVLIVGAGNIGAFLDTPKSDKILTHAHAFTCSNHFKIIGFVDVNRNAAERACEIWGGIAFDNLDQAFYTNEIDVACVATPDEFHYSVLIDLLHRPILLIFAEKPLTQTLAQAEHVIDISIRRNIPILVNYTRRFIPEFVELKKNIKLGRFGKLMTGNGVYGKGFLHNGSHLIDILRYLVGEVCFDQVINHFYDYYKNEPSVGAILTINRSVKFYLNFVNCSKYSVFEIDLFFEKARIKILDLGFKIEIYKVEDNKIFQGYKGLVLSEEKITQQSMALFLAILNILDILTVGAEVCCSALDALLAMQVCIKAFEQIKLCEHEKNNFICL